MVDFCSWCWCCSRLVHREVDGEFQEEMDAIPGEPSFVGGAGNQLSPLIRAIFFAQSLLYRFCACTCARKGKEFHAQIKEA